LLLLLLASVLHGFVVQGRGLCSLGMMQNGGYSSSLMQWDWTLAAAMAGS
jgi:hypothetical protein